MFFQSVPLQQLRSRIWGGGSLNPNKRTLCNWQENVDTSHQQAQNGQGKKIEHRQFVETHQGKKSQN